MQLKSRSFWNWPCFQWLFPKMTGDCIKILQFQLKKIKMSIVLSYQCAILSLLNILSCSKLTEGKKKVFHSGKLTQNMSHPKEKAKKVHLHEADPQIVQCYQSHLKFPHWSQEIIFLSFPWCISRVHCTKSEVNYSLLDALLPHEEPCIDHCLKQNSIM